MKTTYSLRQFHRQIAQTSGEELRLVSVTISIGVFNKIEFSCYVNKFSQIFSGRSAEEVLLKVKQETEKGENEIDAEIEIETSLSNADLKIFE